MSLALLIADDDENFTIIVRRWLEEHDLSRDATISVCHKMDCVWGVLEGDKKVDFIFLDLVMLPDGPQAIIAQIPRLATFCGVIVVSGYPNFKDECLAAGAREFLVKPFDTTTSLTFFEKVAKVFREAKGPSPIEKHVEHLQKMIDPPKP
jgi:DNA-binding NtrC family response regulator